MKILLIIIQLLTALCLIGLILLQTSKGGLQTQTGGDYYRTKRGAERVVFTATIVAAIIFFCITVVNIFVK